MHIEPRSTPLAKTPYGERQKATKRRQYLKNRAKRIEYQREYRKRKKTRSPRTPENTVNRTSLQDIEQIQTQSHYEEGIKSWDDSRELERAASPDPRLDVSPHLRSTHGAQEPHKADFVSLLAPHVIKAIQPYNPRHGRAGVKGKCGGTLVDN